MISLQRFWNATDAFPWDPTETTDTDGDASLTSTNVLVVTVTATVSGRQDATETRVYEVIPRPDS